jgi:hypothetical protein
MSRDRDTPAWAVVLFFVVLLAYAVACHTVIPPMEVGPPYGGK